ncbi:putative non-specific serine/threonine protein kinase [Dioscorea sansibarensis]
MACFGNNGSIHALDPASKDDAPTGKVQPIATPAISVDELKETTRDFGTEALIGEGSYRRICIIWCPEEWEIYWNKKN